MRKLAFQTLIISFVFAVYSCKSDSKEQPFFKKVVVEDVYTGTINSRAITIMGDGTLAFAGANNLYGLFFPKKNEFKASYFEFDTLKLEFRAVAATKNDFFMLSIGNPALLLKTGNNGDMDVVYKEVHEKVFYDSMAFFNENEGIAIGDPTESCLSVIITKDGGKSWKKLPCEMLPKTVEGEGAFAASNTNIAIKGDTVWVLTGGAKSRVFFSADKGKNWEVAETPLVQGQASQGGYSMDFYDAKYGIIMGGDYAKPFDSLANKAVTLDGGKTWKLVANGSPPGYVSCVQYVPGSKAKQLVSVGTTGIFYSKDMGNSWVKFAEGSFYTLRFANDSIAYASGKNRVSKLLFKR